MSGPLYFIILLIITMVNPKEDNIPAVVAHRGGANLAPENTLAAFKKALQLGVDMIEIDIEQTSDSVLVVIHDTKVDRTTNGQGAVDSLSYDQIKGLDCGSWFDTKYKNERIPTLDQVLELVDGIATVLIEIKSGDERYPGIERRTVEIIHKYRARSWTIVQSFNKESVLRVKALDQEIKSYYLLGGTFASYYEQYILPSKDPGKANFGFDGLAVHHAALNNTNIEKIKQCGLEVFTWTVDDPLEMERMISAGVNGIITDSPDLLLSKIR